MNKEDIWILSVAGYMHNGSCCLMKNGEIVFYIEEERLSRIKAENMPMLAILEVKKYTDRLDYLLMDEPNKRNNENPYIRLCQKLGLIPTGDFKGLPDPSKTLHHDAHAASAFYSSGFDKAVCVTVDGGGSYKQWSDDIMHDRLPQNSMKTEDDMSVNRTLHGLNVGVETESVYFMEYPSKTELLYKRLYNPLLHNSYNINNLYFFEPHIGPGFLYAAVAAHLGHGSLECGKAMGWSSYGKPNPNLNLYREDGYVDRNMYLPNTKDIYMTTLTGFDRYPEEDWCYAVQKGTEKYVLNLILSAINNSGCKNVVLSGGYMLNCVANYEYLKHLPEGCKLYIDPPSSDAGLSIGLAKKFWNSKFPSQPKKQETFYLGPPPDYKFDLPCNEFSSKIVSYADVVDLLVDGNIIAMYQGRSEAGPRALGNRSILYDPRVKDGKDFVNRIKNREWYRPFAGTILKEDVHEWFDMRGLEDSPFMMYAVNATDKAKEIVPAIIHVDGTCRIQTVTLEENLHYYNLITKFKEVTGVPILFNTSFNLAGDPLVETMTDALDTLRRSEIKYLYLPERSELIWKL